METYTPGHSHDPANRFRSLIEGICRVLTKHGAARFIDTVMQLLIWNRVMRLARRFDSLAERVRSGRIAETAPARERDAAAAPVQDAARKPRVPPGELPPTHFRWLVNML